MTAEELVYGEASEVADESAMMIDPKLTLKQHLLIIKLWREGYFAGGKEPRGTTLTQAAEDLNVAQDTVSQIKRFALRKLVREYVEKFPEDLDRDVPAWGEDGLDSLAYSVGVLEESGGDPRGSHR